MVSCTEVANIRHVLNGTGNNFLTMIDVAAT
jgi:hypothetical protein